jgi:hypothetical protein
MEVDLRLGTVAMCLLTTCSFYNAYAPAQADEKQPPPSAAASVPRLIRIKGFVRDEAGRPRNGTIAITFSLYKDQNDQVALWQENQNVPLDSNGAYSVLLGLTDEAGLPLEIFSAGEARWLGVRPDGQPEQPRIAFLSVAYALKAADADLLGGKPASAFALAGSATVTAQPDSAAILGSGSSQSASLSAVPATGARLFLTPTSCTSITSDGTAAVNSLSRFTTPCNIESSTIFEVAGRIGIGNTNPAGTLDVSGPTFIRGPLNLLAGAVLPPGGTATSTQAWVSLPMDLEASTFNTTVSLPETYLFRWQATPLANNTVNASATLNLLYGIPGNVSQTGLSIARNGILNFAPGQKFPGLGTVTSVATGTGLTGGPITGSGTISIPPKGVTNALLANSAITVNPGAGLSGGGTVGLGGTITLTNSAPSLGGTVTSVATGTGLTGGPITKGGTISIAPKGITNALLANSAITVNPGAGLSGGGTVGLGGTITLTNSAPSLGGTVTSVATGTGLTGGPITKGGTISLNTGYTDGRYLQLGGGALTGDLTGTTATFTGALKAAGGRFTGTLTTAGALMPAKGAATATQGFNSNALDFVASAFSSGKASAAPQDFRWQAEPAANNSANPSANLNLLFGSSGSTPTETGLSIASNGRITFAPGQVFPGTGDITQVTAGAGLVGGGTGGNITLNLLKTCSAGQTLQWSGTTWVCGGFGRVSGAANGIAYFLGPASVTSTDAPANGEILIGSTGNAPALGTLTAGANVTITSGPGSVKISAAGTPVMPFFITGGEHTGGFVAAGKNVAALWGFLLPYDVTTKQITYEVTTADNTANQYDIGIFDSAGDLLVDTGPTAGTTFAPSAAFRSLAWTQASRHLAAGRYYLGFTTNCASSCAVIGASPAYVSFAINASAGATTGGALSPTLTAPTDSWNTGNQPMIVMH